MNWNQSRYRKWSITTDIYRYRKYIGRWTWLAGLATLFACVSLYLQLLTYFILGTPFSCDICSSSYVCNPYRRGRVVGKSRHKQQPRVKVDPNTGKQLILCNACGKCYTSFKKRESVLVFRRAFYRFYLQYRLFMFIHNYMKK